MDEMEHANPPDRIRRCVSVDAPASAAERIATALESADLAPEAIGIFAKDDGRAEIFAHYGAEPDIPALEALIHAAAGGEAVGAVRVEEIADEDWVRLSQGLRGPVRAGRFLIHGSHDRGRVAPNRLAIEIDAGQAFGTAHHASTRGCLLALDEWLKRRRPKVVIDVGTGTGVLAIAAAKALRRKILASDSDPIAVAIAAENAKKAGAAPFLRVLRATGLAHPALKRRPGDLILANLLLQPLLDLAPILARQLGPRGIAVLSGITQDQARAVEARYRSLGFIMKRRIILDGWTTLVLARRSARTMRD